MTCFRALRDAPKLSQPFCRFRTVTTFPGSSIQPYLASNSTPAHPSYPVTMSPTSVAPPPSGPGWVKHPSGTHYVYTLPLEKSDNDDREYRLIRLASNQLETLLIHDRETDKSSAALDVHVGHLSDPDDLQGLAHFCEHLLFMGTERYPRENDYNQFLSEHSGHSNAFTSLENTNYYFEVAYDYLEGALDRFAQFFIAPLFSEGCTERELRAVDSEHKKNLQSDNWRVFQLEKSLSNPSHPYCHFGTGNLETLRESPRRQGLDIRQELLKFHESYYSANIMKLCVLGRESLDQLTEWTVEKFSLIRDKRIEPPKFEGHPLTEKELMKQIFVKPVKDVRMLDMTFPFPDQYPLFRVQPGRYLSHLMGHEGKGSVLSLLKKKGWANYLQVGSSHGGIGFEFFRISVDLTEDGLLHYEDVITIIFQYITMLKQVGPQESIFREVQSLASLAFRFKEKYLPSQYTSRLAGLMQQSYPSQYVLSGPSLIREYDPQLIEQGLSWLREDAFRITVTSQILPGGVQTTQTEKWYGTEYEVLEVDDRLKKALRKLEPHPALHLPGINDFIPQNFETFKHDVVKPLTKPSLILHTPTVRMWHKKDDTFWIPRANVWVLFRSPLAYATPGNCVKTRLYTDLLKDSLSEYSYDAEVAGLSYNIENQLEGMLLGVGGYNDKLSVLLEKVVVKMKEFEVDRERFGLIKDQLRRSYKNFALEPPYQHALYLLSYITQEKMWTNEEKFRELEDLTADDIQLFFPSILTHLHMEALVHGNVTKEEALGMIRIVEDVMKPKLLLPSQLVSHRSLLLPEGGRFIHQRDVMDKNNVNSAIEYYCQVGDVTQVPLRARLSLLAQIAQEPCFDQLRTKEQLGYLVFSGVRKQTGSMGLRFIIQSEKDTVYLENRIEEFLSKLHAIIQEMSDEEYKAQVNSLIAKKLEKDKNLGQEGGRYWAHVHSGYYEFDQVETDVTELRTITKNSLLEFFNAHIHPSSSLRRKLSVHLRSQKIPISSRFKVNIESLHTCLTSQGVTRYSVEDLQRAMENGLDGATIEDVLRKVLIDETKAEESAIEDMMSKLAATLSLGETDTTPNGPGAVNGTVSSKSDAASLAVPGTIVDSRSTSPSPVDTPPTDLSPPNSNSPVKRVRDNHVLPEGNIIITDLIEFKSKMELSAAAVPVIDFGSVSKL
ncbi:Metalloenzyme, LuxS/M16 peptidase-like protein [Jimgerdemannia flammicorona]|uniref:Metalloenzyme, LuxS/M16 peptidase-like protein n=1 Tax=Jimgerdemannia flammicorona TaxID=994334 RepID=A0A433QSG7_9FUNG|nr:Metalloenzyme, LuxS/M16 peptidase-like protein [Jimgerdemannia flammicorona]